MFQKSFSTIILSSGLLLISGIVEARTYLSSSYQNTLLSQKKCLQRSETIVRNINASDIYVSRVGVYGDVGNDALMIRCIPQKEMVLFVVSGPNEDSVTNLLKRIQRSF